MTQESTTDDMRYIKRECDINTSNMYQQLSSARQEANLRIDVLSQKHEGDIKLLTDRIDHLINSVATIQLKLDGISKELVNNCMFHDRISTTWKVFVIITSILVSIFGTIYIVLRDTGAIKCLIN